MSKNKLIALVVENLALLGIGAVLVIGFWYHEYFYSIYAPVLFVAGGAVIVAMIWTVVWIRKDRDFFNKPKGVIIFEPGEKELVEKGEKTALIFKDHLNTYHKNEVYRAKINITSKKDFARLALKKVFHIELSDLTTMDLARLGFENGDGFRDFWEQRYGRYKKTQEATLITFDLVEGK